MAGIRGGLLVVAAWVFVCCVQRGFALLNNNVDYDCEADSLYRRFKMVIQDVVVAGQEQESFASLNPNTTTCRTDGVSLKKPSFDGEPQKWSKVTDRQVYVFSAFVERRPKANGPAIRVIASGWQEQFNDIGALYCHLWYEDKTYAVAVGPALYHRIYPSLAHPDMWVSHFVLCPLPWTFAPARGRYLPLPYAVSVVAEPCSLPTHALMVLNREPPAENKGDHALCVSPLYGFFKNYSMIAEMFELQRLLGAEEITIYSYSVAPHTRQLLQSYLDDLSSKVNVVMWRSYPSVKSNVWCQRGALNDCLYRMGHQYHHVTVTDLDEVLVPRLRRTWRQLLRHIAKPTYGAFLFQHAYFRRNFTLEAAAEHPLISQTSFWRTDEVTPPGKIRCKAMYRAELAISIDLHFPYLLVEGAQEYILPPEEGMLHHYRAYPMESFIKFPERYNYIEDRHMEIYKEELVERYVRRINEARTRF